MFIRGYYRIKEIFIMESEIEIISLPKRNYKKIVLGFLAVFLVFLVVFFGWRAYNLTKKIIVAKSSSASPYLSGGDDLAKTDISKFESGDRRINILLLGKGGEDHPGGNLTDTIQVVSIDPKNKEVAILSIPRDLYIKVDGLGSHKINSIYTLAKNNDLDKNIESENEDKKSSEDDSKSLNLMKQVTGDLLGVPIHYAAVLNFDGFKKIIDILGGIEINVTEEIYDPYFPDKYVLGYEEFYVEKGINQFDGEQALKYARSRETTSDFDRSKRQQEILIAAKDKALKVMNVKKLSQILNVLSENLKTDLQLGEIEELSKIAAGIKTENIKTKVLDDAEDGLLYADKYEEMYVLLPKDDSLKQMHIFISQFFKDPLIVEEKARIAISSSTKGKTYAHKIYDELVSFGYNVKLTESAVLEEHSKSFIYDYSYGNKPATLSFLKKYLNNIPVVTLDEKDSPADLEIIIGDDYKTNIAK